MRRRSRWIAAAAVGLLAGGLAGCTARPEASRPAGTAATPATAAPVLPELTDRVWVRTDSSAVRGTLKIFLHDGTLLLGSCGEPYQLATWKPEGKDAVSWQEGTQTIRADVVALSADSLTLKLALVHGETVERFRPAPVPFVCPDLPR